MEGFLGRCRANGTLLTPYWSYTLGTARFSIGLPAPASIPGRAIQILIWTCVEVDLFQVMRAWPFFDHGVVQSKRTRAVRLNRDAVHDEGSTALVFLWRCRGIEVRRVTR